MKRRFIDITLLLIFVFFWTISVANAGDDDHLDVAEQGADNTKTITDGAMINVLYAEFLYGHASSEYNENQAKIDNGTVVTAASLLALTVQTTMTSGAISVTASVSTALKALGLLDSITRQTLLESAYESVILSLQSKICDFESSRTTYNITYDTYISMLAGHTGWTSAEVLNTIESNPSYPAVYHKDSVTTSHVHDGVLRASYRTPSEPPGFICRSYAEYGEGNGCGREFDLPSAARDTHYVLCGDTGDPTATDALGCNNFYYNCYSNAKERHKPRDCGREYWLYTSHGWSRVGCNSKYRNCFAAGGLHVDGGPPGSNGWLSHGVGINSGTADSVSPTGGSSVPPTPTDGTPNCPDCTTHCSSPCLCTNSGTCNGAVTDGTPNCPDCTSDCSSPCSCTNSGTCGGSVVDNTPNCSDCTSHCSSPCSCTNSGTCNGSVYTPPSTPSTPPTPPPTPSTPTTVVCGGAAWTGCIASVSSRTEHHVPSCSNCGNSYWTCSEYAYRHTNVLTCKRSGCRMSLTRCQNGPDACTNERYHWF